MIEIKDLLLKSHQAILSQGANKESVKNIISEAIGVPIKSEEIKIQNGIVYLHIKPIYKNEILLKKDEIFSKIKESLGKKSPKNFR